MLMVDDESTLVGDKLGMTLRVREGAKPALLN